MERVRNGKRSYTRAHMQQKARFWTCYHFCVCSGQSRKFKPALFWGGGRMKTSPAFCSQPVAKRRRAATPFFCCTHGLTTFPPLSVISTQGLPNTTHMGHSRTDHQDLDPFDLAKTLHLPKSMPPRAFMSFLGLKVKQVTKHRILN